MTYQCRYNIRRRAHVFRMIAGLLHLKAFWENIITMFWMLCKRNSTSTWTRGTSGSSQTKFYYLQSLQDKSGQCTFPIKYKATSCGLQTSPFQDIASAQPLMMKPSYACLKAHFLALQVLLRCAGMCPVRSQLLLSSVNL